MAIAAAALSATITGIQGGDAKASATSAAITLASAGAFYGTAELGVALDFTSSEMVAAHVVTGGFVGGASAGYYGGNVGAGIASGMLGAGMGAYFGGDLAASMAAGGFSGGTYAALSGGDIGQGFVDGAKYATLQTVFNDMMHDHSSETTQQFYSAQKQRSIILEMLTDISIFDFLPFGSGANIVKGSVPLSRTLKGINPFKGKTVDQIENMLLKRGYKARGSNPKAGKGTYVDPKTGRTIHIDAHHKPPKPPHVGVYHNRTNRGKFPEREFDL